MLLGLPDPPYVAVIFTSVRTASDDEGYAAMAEEMERMARVQPGYLGLESARDPHTGLGVTVSYWATDADARAWKSVAAHLAAQETSRGRWYREYRVSVAEVGRQYGWQLPPS